MVEERAGDKRYCFAPRVSFCYTYRMRPALPSLNALKAFEAAARHESLKRAAAELNVSHAAVSHHIRGLEKSLRVRLFERTGRGVILTDTGQTFAKEVSQGFDILAGAASRFVRSGRRRQRLSITCEVAFAAYWLIPRIGRFMTAYPSIELVIDPNARSVDPAKEEFDFGIRFGDGKWRGLTAEKLLDSETTVVCSPALLKSRKLKTPADLDPAAMLQERDRSSWKLWLEAAGVSNRVVPSGPTLLADLTVLAAEAGHGYALAEKLFTVGALAAKRLVIPFDISSRGGAYYLVRVKAIAPSKAAQQFRQWLFQEIEISLAELAQRNRQ